MKKKENKQSESKKIKARPNRLIHEKSPYLLQHAYNPVDWYPWGEEAFRRAKEDNKPIFLSIGYSTCHWCHVMAHESFENPEVARLMNEVFISIKVDREERPDLDNIFMSVCQMMTGSGGWPLTIIMTPDKNPFFATTYIPKKTRLGRVGLMELIPRLKKLWKTQHNELISRSNQITMAIKQQISEYVSIEELDETTLKLAYAHLAMRFDNVYGGFSSAPKFPTPHNLLFLLRYWKRTGKEKALEMVERTLEAIQFGGIKDHIGFGFHRYSTDNRWILPHFEKMLYDQALLGMTYTEAYQATGKEKYAKTAHEIFTYVLRDMTSEEGGFYSAEDADSEGEEGKFYLWTKNEIKNVLDREESDLVFEIFNIEEDGNFYEEATGKKKGKNILHLTESLKEFSSSRKIPEKELQKRMEEVRKKLYNYREGRIHPDKDDKILTDWNGLMIAALAKGARTLDERQYGEAAKRAADFILKNMRTSDGRLLHRYRDGQATIQAHVDDYAFLIWGLLELYEANFQVGYLRAIIELNKDLIDHYWDEDKGGFYFIADDAEEILVRQKSIYDGAVPSGNSVAMLDLLRLGRITANPDYEEKAAQIARTFSMNIKRSPSLHTQFMVAMDFWIGPSYEIVIIGNSRAKDTKEMLEALRKHFIPNKVVILKAAKSKSPEIIRIAEFTKYQTSIDGKATAYVCADYKCKMPTTDVSKMLELLNVK
ncbi:MAG: thioredoxin domain-containing protein [Candidatus Stahlbacteria bacterium]|nr:MAG: thioredoxin domain-containing protein [Candidatus Stahlbacteria bacterium]